MQRLPIEHRGPGGRVRLVSPGVGGEAAELVADIEAASRVVDDRLDLPAVADDARIGQETVDIIGPEARHRVDLEVRERGAEVLALAEDRQPRETRHEALEAELLEEAPIVRHRPPPLAVVIGPIQLVA